jgi:hypothetical protein
MRIRMEWTGSAAALGALVALLACAAPAAGPSPQDADARMERVAREAADGIRGQAVFVVVTGDYVPYVFADSASAIEHAQRTGGRYFGRFFTPDETRAELGRVVAVNVTFEYPDGTTSTLALPDSADAFFWSLAAFDKFVRPYYRAVHSQAFADSMRSRFTNSEAYVMAVCHDVKSIDCNLNLR